MYLRLIHCIIIININNNKTSTDTASDLKSDKQTDNNLKDNSNLKDKESTTINLTSSSGGGGGHKFNKYPQPTTTPANSPPPLNQEPILLNYVGVSHQQNLPMRNVPLSAHHNSQTMNTETILHTAAACSKLQVKLLVNYKM